MVYVIPTERPEPSWASLAQTLDDCNWTTITKDRKKDRRQIRGTSAAKNCAVMFSVKEKPWHVFVSRLHVDTTVDDLTDFLSDCHINVVKCS